MRDPDKQPDKRFGHVLVRPAKVSIAAPASFLHWGMLLTDLDLGGTCSIQEYTYGAGGYSYGYDYTYSGGCTAGETYDNCRDPLGELQGTADLTGAIFWLDANNNALILRVTCPWFIFTPCASAYYGGYGY